MSVIVEVHLVDLSEVDLFPLTDEVESEMTDIWS